MTKEDLKNYLQLVKDTLAQQQTYFRIRTTDALRKSQAMEAELKRRTTWIEEELGFRPKQPVQTSFFDNSQNTQR